MEFKAIIGSGWGLGRGGVMEFIAIGLGFRERCRV